MKLLKIILFISLYFLNTGIAQTFPYRHYTIKDGLPNTNILSFVQDDKGFIWLSTQNSLSRFDGYAFNNSIVSEDKSLTENIIAANGDKIFYLVQNRGIYSFDGINYKVVYSMSPNEFKVNRFLMNNDTLFLFSDRNIYIVSNKKLIDSVALAPPLSPIPSKILTVFITNDNVLLIGTTNGLFIYNNRSVKPFSNKLEVPVYSINEDQDGNIWIGSTDKIIKLNQDGVISQQIKISIYQPYPIENLVIDNFYNIWFSIKNYGLFVLSEGQMMYIGKNLGFGKSQINFIQKDSDENIWVGTYGKGLYCFHDIYIKNYNEIDNLSHEFVSYLTLDKKNRLLIGSMNSIDIYQQNKINNLETDFYSYTKEIKISQNNDIFVACVSNKNGLLKIINNNNNTYYFVAASSILPDGNILLVGDWQNNITYYTISGNNLSLLKSVSVFDKRERINKIYRDINNNLWIGSVSGLSLIKNNQFKYFTDSELINCPVNDIKPDNKNNIWFASDKGLSKFDGKNWTWFKSIKNYDLKSSTGIMFDKKNDMWISNPSGLVRFNKDKVFYWDDNSGLVGNEIYSLCYDSLQNYVWIGTNEGISRLNLDQYDKLKFPPLSILINKIFIDDSLVHNNNVELNINNSIRIEFISLNYHNPESVIYQYRFKDIDEDWNETENTFVEFSSLSPGSYNLLIRSHTLNREWNKPLELSFIIKTPFYKSVYFYFSVILIFVSLVIYFADRRIHKIRLKDKEAKEIQEKISDLKHQALFAMMNPHFIFNSLTSIQYFINSNDAEGANEYLAKFAKLIRLNLESAEKGFVTINEELDRLKIYLMLEKLRFGNLLEYSIKIDNEINVHNTLIPNMVIQTFVENALWHGILPKNSNGEIDIIFEKFNQDRLKITIIDNGIGYKKGLELKKPGHISKGMKIVEDRLNLLNEGNESLLTVQDINEIQNDKTGTIVTIVLTPKLIRKNK